MDELVDAVRRVGLLFESAMADTSEQIAGLQTVSQSISELGLTTQQNVGLADDASRSAAELGAQAARLGATLSAFDLGAAADAAPAAAEPHPPQPAKAAPAPPPARHPAARRAPAPAFPGGVEFF